MEFITYPHCTHCGQPFEYDQGEETICAVCSKEKPDYTLARASLVYNDYCKKLISNFKYNDQTWLKNHLAKWLYQSFKSYQQNIDIIIPVPLHVARLRKRRYNQSALLATKLHQKTHIPVYYNALIRKKSTPPQARLDVIKRKKNVANAFKINPDYVEYLKNKNVGLIDDVQTTGATINACSKVLLRANVKSVNVFTIAKALK